MLTKEFYTVLQEIETLLNDTVSASCCMQTLCQLSSHADILNCSITQGELGFLYRRHVDDVLACVNAVQGKLSAFKEAAG
jgi:hypothetical protein